MSAKEIFEKLLDMAHAYSWRLSSSMRHRPHGKPGELLEKLPPEERAELQSLASKDVEKHANRSVLNYMIGTYPENTSTVHTHSVKKDEEQE